MLDEMLKKIHPIRALLAFMCWGATIYFLVNGIIIPDAWWVGFGAISAFYFEDMLR